MLGFAIERTETIYEGFVVDLERRFVRHGDEVFDREVVVHPGAVAIIAIDESFNVVLLEQYRAAVEHRIFEIPAGTCDHLGEAGRETAQRELYEETGIRAESFESLGVFLNSPGFSSQRTEIFLATNLSRGERQPEGLEERDARVSFLPFSEAIEMMEGGRIQDATTCLALSLTARRHGI